MQLSYYTKRTILGQATTATATSLTGEVDMQNWEGVQFYGVAGSTSAIAHTLTAKIGASTTDTFVAIATATKATTSGNDGAAVDVYKPTERWVQAVWSSTAASHKVLIAVQYGPRNLQTSSTDITSVVGSAT